ncbi:MAG: SDR family oxidoreductase [Christensenella sp.]|nr:SDR family oxidoreductase [Christensenella sp.]
MNKATVIGANSYIARNLIHRLHERYQDIRLALYDYQDEQADGYAPYKEISILDPSSCADIDMDSDAIYMFVGKTGTEKGFSEYDSYIDINEKALLNIIDQYIKKKSSARFVFPSSRLIYKGSDVPLKEDAQKETKTVYAVNKLACEGYLAAYGNAFDINYSILRLCIPFGTLVRGAASYGTADFFINKAAAGNNLTIYGNGKVYRTFTYIGDVCDAFIDCAECAECRGGTFNIGGMRMNLDELASVVTERYGVKKENIPYPVMVEKIESGSTVFDSEKLDTLIGIKKYVDIRSWITES